MSFGRWGVAHPNASGVILSHGEAQLLYTRYSPSELRIQASSNVGAQPNREILDSHGQDGFPDTKLSHLHGEGPNTNEWIVQQRDLGNMAVASPVMRREAGINDRGTQSKRSLSLQSGQAEHMPPPKRSRVDASRPSAQQFELTAEVLRNSHKETVHETTARESSGITRPVDHQVSSDGQTSKVSPGIDPATSDCHRCCRGKDLMLETAETLSNLSASLTSGLWPQISSQSHCYGSYQWTASQVAEVHQMLALLARVNDLAGQVTQFAPNFLQSLNVAIQSGSASQNADTFGMTDRRLGNDLDNQRRHSSGSFLSGASSTPQSFPSPPPPTQLQTQNLAFLESKLPPIRSISPTGLNNDGLGVRLPSMQPPPPPYSSRNSPPASTSYNIPSPATNSYSHSNSDSALHSYGKRRATSVTSLPGQPSSPTPSNQSFSSVPLSPAVQAHTAALQHEVSRQSYALSTLQGEHDKLLGALKRSRIRAVALEEKASVGEREVCELAEEKEALERRVKELEEEVSELRSQREDERVGRVRERGQYVEMLRLGAMLERRQSVGAGGSSNTSTVRGRSTNSPTSSVTVIGTSDTTNQPQTTKQESQNPNEVNILRVEVRSLKTRALEMEAVLRTVAEDIRTADEVVKKAAESRTIVLKQVEQALIDQLRS